MRIAVAATPAVAIPTLNALLESDHVLALIITQPDKPAGRGLQVQESDVSQWALTNSITTFKPAALAVSNIRLVFKNPPCFMTFNFTMSAASVLITAIKLG